MSSYKLNITIDNDPQLGYEINSPVKKFFNHLFIPILNTIPSFLRELIKRTHHSAKKVIEKATTHEAIEVLYNHGEPEHTRNPLQSLFYYIWFSTDNPKALRNRLRLVEKEIKEAINKNLREGKQLNLLSIASGSARAILDSLDSSNVDNQEIFVTFLDKCAAANKYSEGLTLRKDYPSNYRFKWIEDTASNFPAYFENSLLPNIVEVVGLLDYFDDKAVEKLFTLIYKNLPDDGVLITSNIVDNSERKFVTNVVGWEMIYRDPEVFFHLAVKAGFKPDKIKISYEPLKIHFVMVARK